MCLPSARQKSIHLAPYPKPRALDLLIKSSLHFVIECHLTQGHFLPEISFCQHSIVLALQWCFFSEHLFCTWGKWEKVKLFHLPRTKEEEMGKCETQVYSLWLDPHSLPNSNSSSVRIFSCIHVFIYSFNKNQKKEKWQNHTLPWKYLNNMEVNHRIFLPNTDNRKERKGRPWWSSSEGSVLPCRGDGFNPQSGN